MSDENLRAELYDSFKNRAMIYYLIYDELRKELGADRAEELLSRAIYRRGQQRGRQRYGKFAPSDLAGLAQAFVGASADDGRMFKPEVVRNDPERARRSARRLPAPRCVARSRAARGRRGHALSHRRAGRRWHVRGRRIPILGRHLATRRRGLLLSPYPAGDVILEEWVAKHIAYYCIIGSCPRKAPCPLPERAFVVKGGLCELCGL